MSNTQQQIPDQGQADAQLAQRLSVIIEHANARVKPTCDKIRKVRLWYSATETQFYDRDLSDGFAFSSILSSQRLRRKMARRSTKQNL